MPEKFLVKAHHGANSPQEIFMNRELNTETWLQNEKVMYLAFERGQTLDTQLSSICACFYLYFNGL